MEPRFLRKSCTLKSVKLNSFQELFTTPFEKILKILNEVETYLEKLYEPGTKEYMKLSSEIDDFIRYATVKNYGSKRKDKRKFDITKSGPIYKYLQDFCPLLLYENWETDDATNWDLLGETIEDTLMKANEMKLNYVIIEGYRVLQHRNPFTKFKFKMHKSIFITVSTDLIATPTAFSVFKVSIQLLIISCVTKGLAAS